MDYMLEIQTVPSISLAVASEPYDYLAEQYKRYWPEIYLFNVDGVCLGKQEVKGESKFEKFMKGSVLDRDKVLKENDDSKIVVALSAIPADVNSLILTIKEDPLHKSAKDTWYGNSRYRILDEDTYQSIEYEKLSGLLEKSLKVSEGTAEEAVNDVRVAICGRVYKDLPGGKWTYEAYHTALSGKKADVENKILTLGGLMKKEELPSIDIDKWEEESNQQKMLAAKTKGGKSKKEDTKMGKSQSKADDKKNKSKAPKDEPVEEKKETEETLQMKLAGYMDFPIGPLTLDCTKTAEQLEGEIVAELEKANRALLKLCDHGVEVFLKDKQLKNPKQVLHNAHILRQFIVRPKEARIIPQADLVQEVNKEEGEAKDEGKEEEEQ